jgi:ABC-type multidrug transport system fused ATPase/permease subunit
MNGPRLRRAGALPAAAWRVLTHGPRSPQLPADSQLRAMEWERHDAEANNASIWTILGALPTAIRVVAGLSWQVAPALTVGAVVMATLSGVAAATGLLAANRVLMTLFAAGPTPSRVIGALGSIVVLTVTVAARAGLVSGVAACGARLGPGVRRLAECRVVTAASFVQLHVLDDADYHDELSRACDRCLPMLEQAVTQCVSLLTAGIALAAAVITVGFLHPLLGVVVLLSALPAAMSAVRASQLRHQSLHKIVSYDRRVRIITSLLTDRDSAAELRAFGAQHNLLAEHETISRLREKMDSYTGLAQEYHGAVGRSLTGLATVGVYAVLGWLLYTRAIPLAVAATAVVALQAAHTAVTQLAQSITRLHEQGLFILDYQRAVSLCEERARPTTGIEAPETPSLIELDRLTFSYPGAERPAIADVSATIRAGQVVALVGENGSGKTTLSKLLAGLYQPDEGAIRWDGTALTQFTAASVAARTAVIMQQPTRWPLTARAATTLGVHPDDVRDDLLDEAARATGADQVIDQLPKGWDTLLSKQFAQGYDLSGGQWQRLAGARALYRDAAILIADEPTASLDARAEARFYDTLSRIAAGRTVILVTHRLGTVRMADLVLMLDKGRLIETGTHDELIAADGRYAELYRIQADLYASLG